jgi:hypothetical protein
MAVTDVIELHERSCKKELEKYRREYQRVFKVFTNDPQESHTSVIAGVGISVGAPYITPNESDLGALVKSIEPEQDDDPQVWTVTYTYDTDVPDPDEQEENPLARPAKWKFSFTKEQRSIAQDLDGIPMINSAGQPFLPPVEATYSRPQIEVTVNKATFSFTLASDLQDCVNANVWMGFPVGTVLLDAIDVNDEYENGIKFWVHHYVLSLNFEGWIPTRILDQGYYQLTDPSSSVTSSYIPGSGDVVTVQYSQRHLAMIRDQFGAPLNSPSLLDGYGRALRPGFFPVYLNRRLYRWNSFSSIP